LKNQFDTRSVLKTAQLFAALAMAGSLLLLLNGCGSSDNESGGSSELAITDPNEMYVKNVEPVFYRSCVSCHVNGGIAPFSLIREENGFNNAILRRQAIKYQLQQKLMPPFLASNDSSCKRFEHDNAVSNAEIAAIDTWADTITPDNATDISATPPPAPSPKATIENPDLILQMPGTYSVSPNVTDDYRCFVIDPGLNEEMLMTAFDIVPGNAGIVHHVILFNLTNLNEVTVVEQKDANEPGLGYTCFGDSGASPANASVVAGWAPGTGATTYPQNTGLTLTAGTRLIMQVHYNTANAQGNYDDLTKMNIKMVPSAGSTSTKALMVPHYVNGFALTAANNVVTETINIAKYFPFTNVHVHGVFPHMHTYGSKIKASKIAADGSEECLVNVDQWDFEWQRFYTYDSRQSPVIINPQTESIAIRCEYNIPTTDINGNPLVVNEGSGSGDEMCLNFYYITLESSLGN